MNADKELDARGLNCPLPILKAKINPDLHMAEDLKNTGKGNLFVVFGEPDIGFGGHEPAGRAGGIGRLGDPRLPAG